MNEFPLGILRIVTVDLATSMELAQPSEEPSSLLDDPKALSVILAALVTAIFSLAVAVLARKTQQGVIRDQGNIQTSLAELTSKLEGTRRFGETQRGRFLAKIDALEAAAVTMSTHAELAGRTAWMEEKGLAHAAEKMSGAFFSLNMNLAVLKRLNVLPEQEFSKCSDALSQVRTAWEQFIDAATPGSADKTPTRIPWRLPQVRRSQRFASRDFVESGHQLQVACGRFEEALVQATREALVPIY